MPSLLQPYPNFLRAQNFLAAAVFAVLFSGNILSWLLDLHPHSAWLWWASVKVNRLATYANLVVDVIPMPSLPLSVAFLSVGLLIPVLCHLRRSLIGTALCSHMALFACVAMIAAVSPGVISRESVADLSPSFQPSSLTPGATPMLLVGGVLLVLCVLNHMMIIRSLRSR
jgi:hypothetical protein